MALLFASIIGTAVTLPFDAARTRLMNAQTDVSRNRLNYSGVIDVFMQTFVV